METNRNVAELEFQMAKHKLHEKDFKAARESALRAKELFPGLEGLDQFLETLNVLVHSNAGPHGENEWYGILGVNPSDTHQVIRKSYYRKSLILHPDKTRDILGAGDAIRLLTLAWGVLSDQESRAEYDMRKEEADKFYDFFKESAVNGSSTAPTAPTAAATTPMAQTQQESPSRPSPKPRARKGTSGQYPNQQPRKHSKSSKVEKAHPAMRESFWTICTNCKMRYEYDRIYLNVKLTCPATDCKQLFAAIATTPPKKTYKRKHTTPSRETSESSKSTAPQDASGNVPVVKVPKPCTTPILATPVSSVPFSATVRAGENVQDGFLGQ